MPAWSARDSALSAARLSVGQCLLHDGEVGLLVLDQLPEGLLDLVHAQRPAVAAAPRRPGQLLRALGMGVGHRQQVVERAFLDVAAGGLEVEGEELVEVGAGDGREAFLVAWLKIGSQAVA